MRARFFAAAFAALFMLPAFAQERRVYESDEFGPIGRGEGWARRFAHSMVDGFLGSEYYVEDTLEEETGILSVDKGDENAVKVTRKHYGPGHTPDAHIGLNVLAGPNSMNPAPGLPQRTGKGFEWSLSLGQWGYHMSRNVGVNTAVYLTRSRYWLTRDSYLDWDGHWNLSLMNGEYDGRDVRQGYLRYWSFRFPFCLEFCSSSRRGPFLAFGPELEYRFGDVSKVRLSNGEKCKVTGDLNMNALAVNALVRVGINNFGVIARYSFTELFQSSGPVECYPIMIGISRSF